ncbi:RRP6-like 3-like protein [Drosera capensis]
MESKQKLKLSLTAACVFGALSIYLAATTLYRKRRNRNKNRRSSCYLKIEEGKPQYRFKRILADNSYSQFKHLNRTDEADKNVNSHPFEVEIGALLEDPKFDSSAFDGKIVMEMTGSHIWVETESQLQEVVDVLRKQKIIGVDTEQHSLRSFLGFTALIQISTSEEDYLVDTIALHDAVGMLRPIFADPSICKVFHGADNDVLWLQRDFHIYVVNLFDTAKACEFLSKPQKSLAYLLETYCGVATNKLLQREDWRQRPLPSEMVQYARADAHFLLHIAKCLIDELQVKDDACQDDRIHFLLEACRRSNVTCLQLYMKDEEAFPGEAAASSLLSRHFPSQGGTSSLSSNSQNLMRKLCAWRDLMARVHDESLRYVMSDHAIVALADKVPASEAEIFNTVTEVDHNLDSFASIVSLSSPSPVIFAHWEDLLLLLKDGVGSDGAILHEILQSCIGSSGSCPLSIFNYALLSRSNLKHRSISDYEKNIVKNAKKVGKKASRELFAQKFSCKSPVYHNCRIYANDGRLLCYCDRRKLEWYLQRDLAKLVEEDPPGIMLLFEPKGRPEDEDNGFYIQMHFPEHLKSHRSHDIVLLCVDCHEVAHAAAEKYKRQVSTEFGIPLFVRKVADPGQAQSIPESFTSPAQEEKGVSPLQLHTAAMALLRHGQRMPSKRRKELIEVVRRYYGGREISEKDLESALLVGLSPQERRKFQKKRGLPFNFSEARILPDREQTNVVHDMITPTDDTFEADTEDKSENTIGTLLNRSEPDDVAQRWDGKQSSLSSELEASGKHLAGDAEVIILDKDGASETNDALLQSDANGGGGHLPSGSVNPYRKSNKTLSLKHNSKLSLLGHGPHGKQVVEYLLDHYGEDGIRNFCQRWRQVFVDSVHPRYLPAGWDIMHSGRRDFGEYSVYNPAKTASATS